MSEDVYVGEWVVVVDCGFYGNADRCKRSDHHMSEIEIEAHNQRELWRDVINHLTIAGEALGQALGAMEDAHADVMLIRTALDVERRVLGLVPLAVSAMGDAIRTCSE